MSVETPARPNEGEQGKIEVLTDEEQRALSIGARVCYVVQSQEDLLQFSKDGASIRPRVMELIGLDIELEEDRKQFQLANQGLRREGFADLEHDTEGSGVRIVVSEKGNQHLLEEIAAIHAADT